MRTTLTIDDDLAESIQRLRQKSGLSLRSVIANLLRQGLEHQTPSMDQKCFVGPTFKMGFKAGLDPTHMNRLNDELDTQEVLD